MKKIFLIEDNPGLTELIEVHVKNMGLAINSFPTGEAGLLALDEEHCDLLILDLMLPGMTGMDVCRKLRSSGTQIPIIMLTAKTEEIDIVLGLEAGADDYITKPFSIRELQARINARLRRTEKEVLPEPHSQTELLKFGKLEIDHKKRKIVHQGEELTLTKKEYDLLWHLASNPGVSYSREVLLRDVWGYEYQGYEHTVNAHINRLRSKIEEDMSNPKYVLTTWGVGYRFNENIV